MTDFIHYLSLPTDVADYNYNIVDVNNSMLKNSGFSKASDFKEYNKHLIDRSKFHESLERVKQGINIENQLYLVRKSDESVLQLAISANKMPDYKLIIIQTYTVEVNDFFLKKKYTELLHEIRNLRPYLNKHGQKVFEKIFNNALSFNDDTFKSRIDNCIHLLVKQWPNLSATELLICSLIVMGLSIKEISVYTGLTDNALRVNIHRICVKRNIESRNLLVEQLNAFSY